MNDLSILLGQLYAIALLTIGLGILLNTKYYLKAYDTMMKETGMIMVGGIFALLVGFLIVTRHNVWSGWPTIITIFGWIAVLKGVLLLALPELSLSMFKKWFFTKSFLQFQGAAAIILGLVLGYFSFLA